MNWHLERIAAKLIEVRQGKIKRLVINLPPLVLVVAIGGDHDDRNIGPRFLDPTKQSKAVHPPAC